MAGVTADITSDQWSSMDSVWDPHANREMEKRPPTMYV